MRVSETYPFRPLANVADPHLSFHFVDADPDPSFYFDADPDRLLTLMRIRIKVMQICDKGSTDPPRLHSSILIWAYTPPLWASTQLLNFDFDADPNLDFAIDLDADSDPVFHSSSARTACRFCIYQQWAGGEEGGGGLIYAISHTLIWRKSVWKN